VRPRLDPELLAVVSVAAPGTELRDGLDRIMHASRGALVVVGDSPEVRAICTGGFGVDVDLTPQRLAELAKMDGAILISNDAKRIIHANVHLMPSAEAVTSETGTRHRTAERTARSIDATVIAVSEAMASITVYRGPFSQRLESPAELLGRANQALQTLGAYRTRLDEVQRYLERRASTGQSTWRDVVSVLQRAEMVDRIAQEIEVMLVALGAEGRLLRLQLDELVRTSGDVRLEIFKSYGESTSDREALDALIELQCMSDDELFDLPAIATLFHPATLVRLDEVRLPRS
jgi:diadenylate cyclase